MIDPPLCVGYQRAGSVAFSVFCHRTRDERAKATCPKCCCPFDLTITTGEQGQVEMGDRCPVTNRRLSLLRLFVRDEATAARGRFQPTGLSLLLASEAGKIVNFVVPTGMRDNLSHAAMMLGGDSEATGLSQIESFAR